MIKYSKIINNETGLCEVGTGTNEDFYKSIGMELMEVQQSDIDNAWYLSEKCPMKTDEQKAQEERERIAALKVTKRVFALALQQYRITYTQLKELISTNDQAQLEWDLCVELERSNPLLDVMGLQMGITSEQLDYIFRKANGEEVEPPTTEENSEIEQILDDGKKVDNIADETISNGTAEEIPLPEGGVTEE